MTDLQFEVVDARTEPHAAVPTIMFRTRAEEADGKRVHAAALRCQIRIEPQRRRYSEQEEENLYELFGETPQWGNSLRPVPVDARVVDGGPLRRNHGVRPAGRVHLRLRGGRGQVHARVGGRRHTSDLPLLGDRVHTRRVGVLGRAALVVDRVLVSPARRRLAQHDGRLLSRERLHPCPARHAGRSSAFPGDPRPPDVGPGLRTAAQGGRRRAGHERDRHEIPPTPPEPERRDRFETARTVADAVLYEGYVLYPYRASSRKNQVRFQWGVLTPTGLQRDGRVRALVGPDRMPRRPRRAHASAPILRVRVRCLQTQRRRVEAHLRAGRGSPPPGLRSGPSTPSRWTGRPTSSGTRRSTTWSTCLRSSSPRAAPPPTSCRSTSRADPRPSPSTELTAHWPVASSVSGVPIDGVVRVATAPRSGRLAVREGDGDGRERHHMERRPLAESGRRGSEPGGRAHDVGRRRRDVRLTPRSARRCRRGGPGLPERRHLPGSHRPRRRGALLADHPLRPPRGGEPEPGRPLRRTRDRRDPGAAGDDAHRHGEGRGPRDRRPCRRHHRPLRLAVTRDHEPPSRPDAPGRTRMVHVDHPRGRGRPVVGPRRPTSPSTRGRTRSGWRASSWRRGRLSGSTRRDRRTRRTCSSMAGAGPWPACSPTSTAGSTSPSPSTTTRRRPSWCGRAATSTSGPTRWNRCPTGRRAEGRP